MTDRVRCFKPIPRLIGRAESASERLGELLSLGYPRERSGRSTGISAIGWRITCSTVAASGPYRPPEGMSLYEHLQRLG